MDHKTWLWKKKSTEKTLDTADKANLSQKVNEDETLLTDKAKLGRNLQILDEKLSSALSECNAKDELVEKHAKMGQETLAGWERAEAEAMSLKQELDRVLRQKVAGEERLTHLDMALKECMQQLRFVREEQEQRIHDAVMKTTTEFEKVRIVSEGRLADTNKRLSKSETENIQLGKALLAKEKLIEDINRQRNRAEADFNALMTRLESTEKENASLKYEVRVLEKELEIRNEEREFNRRTADVTHKQHLESAKKIAKLESECQSLRLLVRKRLPGPAALAKMKNEVVMLSRDQAETRRRKSSLSLTGSMDFAVDNVPDTPSKRINYLAKRLCAMEEENRSLKETLNKTTNELRYSKTMHAHNASKLPHEFTLASMSDMGSDEKLSCAESWASGLVSELEHSGNGKQIRTLTQRTVGASDIGLMDDFVEMEKLAVVSMDKQFGNSCLGSVEGSEIVDPLEIQSGGGSLAAADRKIVAAPDSGLGKFPSWIQDALNVILEQNRVTHKKPDEILEEIKVALQHINSTNYSDFIDTRDSSNHFHASNHSDISGYVSWKPEEKSPLMDSANSMNGDEISMGKKSSHRVQSNLSKSVCKTIELIEGISLPSLVYGDSEMITAKDGSYFPNKNSEAPSGYMVRVFQWKTSELGAVLQKFIRTCNDLLSGSADFETFAEELTASLEWVLNHCFSLQDVSSMRDAIKKQFDWDESRSESEVEPGRISEADKLHAPKEQSLYFPIVSPWNEHKMEEMQPHAKEESKKMKDELVSLPSAKKDLEVRLQSQTDKSKSSIIPVQEPQKTMISLKTEVGNLKELKGMIENDKLVNGNLDTQLKVTRGDFNEVSQRFSVLETELEDSTNCCEELEATCLDLQLQLASGTNKEIPKYDVNQEENQLRTDLEITAASEKLAECQETILNLGKQLKALATPRETAVFDKLISDPNNSTTTTIPKKSINQRSSLLDKMLAEDNAESGGDLKFPKTKEVVCISDPQKPLYGRVDPPEMFLHRNGVKCNEDEAVGSSLAIVPSKKKGAGLLKKLLWRRNKGNSKKLTLPFAA